MGVKFNPLNFAGFSLVGSGGGGPTSFKAPVSDAATLPALGNQAGDVRVTLDTSDIWVWDAVAARWENQTVQLATGIGSTPNLLGYSLEVDDSVANLRQIELTLQPADATNPGIVSTSAQSFAGDKTFTGNVIVTGDFTVNGTETVLNVQTLEVEDNNILINNNGTDATAEDAGITVERTGVNGVILYQDSLASKFKIGSLGDERQVATVSHTQTLANKTISALSNTISDLANANIAASAAIDATKIHDGSVDNTEFGYLNGVLSPIQTQLDGKQPLDATLTALAAYNTDGILVQTAPDTFAGREIVAGSLKVTVTNGDGVLGNPSIDLDDAQIDHDQLLKFVANEHVDHSTVQIIAGVGLVGGGDITVSRTLDLADTAVTPGSFGSASEVSTFTVDQQGRLTAAGEVLIDIPSSQINDFAEAAQDAVGGILTDSLSVDFTYDDALNTITADVLPAGVDHDQLLNFVSNEHVDHSTVEIATAAATSGLTGGGDITITRNLSVDITGTTALVGAVEDTDEILIYDASATALRKATRAQIIGQTSGDINESTAALADNTIGGTVTGLAFANATVRSAKVQYSIVVDATADLFEAGTLELIQRGSDWALSREATGDSLVDFEVDTTGQVLYTTPSYAGFVDATMKFRAMVTTV